MSASEYILVINGKPEGPFTMEQLKGLNVKPGDFLKTVDMLDYKEAHEIEELRQLFHFQKQTVMPQYFAGFDQRLLASALDWFMVSGVFILLAFVSIWFVDSRESMIIVAVSILSLIVPANFIYHVVMESSGKQATYGKQILKIKVCDIHGDRINVGKAFGRNFCKLLSLLSIVGYLISFFNKHQQCLHDIMAGTLVVKDRLI